MKYHLRNGNRKYFFGGVGLLVAAAVAAGFVARSRNMSRTTEVAAAATPNEQPSIIPAKLEAAADRVYAEELARSAAASSQVAAPERSGKALAQAVGEAKVHLSKMYAVRGLVTQERVRREEARAILASREGREVIERTLTEPGYAKAAFGDEFSAEARFYATKVVSEAARGGEPEYGLRIAQKLAQSLDTKEGASQGRTEDLVDVLRETFRATGPEYFQSNPQRVLSQIGIDPAHPTLSHDTLANVGYGILLGMGGSKMSPLEARDLVEKTLGLSGG
ncbi:hypothetical protein LVJ94_25810 [Pendulispora rubella]|uniref:Uncharacterized protein n=1 Tax=Pendulispora rubella TaxID=2741070 RepID=A0ABZ2LJQ7_9BACT